MLDMTLRTLNDTPEIPEAATPAREFDPALSAALERAEGASSHILAAQRCLWTLAKKDETFTDIALQLAGLQGLIESRLHVLEEQVGL